MRSSVREYAILYVGGKRLGGGTSIGGGNAVLSTGQHELGGAEHTGQLPVERISTAETDAAMVEGPDGIGGIIARLLAAADVTYDPSMSGLSATDVQDAIDEVAALGAGGSGGGGGGGGGSEPEPRQVLIPSALGSTTTMVGTWSRTCLSTSILFALSAAVVATAPAITGISQTNVTWTLVHAASNGANAKVELWKGVPSGTPGSTTTITYASAAPAAAAVFMEWPDGTGIAGTLDQSADNTGTANFSVSGVIVPSSAANLTFFLGSINNGSVEMMLRSGWGFKQPVPPGGWGFSCFGWLWGSQASLQVHVPQHANAVWVNTLVSLV